MKLIRVILVAFLFVSLSVRSFAILQETGNIEYSVQILISDKHLEATNKKFKGVAGIREEVFNNTYKYTTGNTQKYSEAVDLMTKMQGLGFKEAFIVRYKDGKRAPLENTTKTETPKTEVVATAAMEEQAKPASANGEEVKSQAATPDDVKQTPAQEGTPAKSKSGKEKPVVGSTIIQTDAEFPGGADSLAHFIIKNMHYPEERLTKQSEARVLVSFTVDYTGKIKNAKVDLGVSKECDAEALRIVSIMPDWKPSTINGNAVDKEILLPVNFYRPAK